MKEEYFVKPYIGHSVVVHLNCGREYRECIFKCIFTGIVLIIYFQVSVILFRMNLIFQFFFVIEE